MRRVPVLTLAVILALTAAPVFAQVTNGPAIDDNNRIVGTTGNNIFVNGVVPGETVTSVVNLGGISGSTPAGGATASALVTIGAVSVDDSRARTSSILASGANTAVDGGLTATLNADGSYALSADDSFDAAVIVSFGSSAGAAQLLAAPAVAVSTSDPLLLDATGLGQAAVTADGSAVSFDLQANTGRLAVFNSPVEAGDWITVSVDYMVDGGSADGVTVAVVGFDGALDGTTVQYNQVIGANVEAGVTKNVAVTFKSQSGSVIPGVQVTNSGAAKTATVSNIQVLSAGPLTDYALDPSVVADGIPGTGNAADWSSNINGQDAGAVTADGSALTLAGTDGGDTLSNAFAASTVDGGIAVAECMVKSGGDAGAGAFFALVLTDGATSTANSYTPASAIPADSFAKVSVSGTWSAGGTAFCVMQAFNFTAMVEDVAVRLVTDADGAFDANLVN